MEELENEVNELAMSVARMSRKERRASLRRIKKASNPRLYEDILERIQEQVASNSMRTQLIAQGADSSVLAKVC